MKEEGNQLFKTNKWSEAYEKYTEALDVDKYNRSVNAKLFLNRAIVAAKVIYFYQLYVFYYVSSMTTFFSWIN